MRLLNSGGQAAQHNLYIADVTLAGSSAVLVLARSSSRSFLALQNMGSHAMYVEIGFGSATATITSGAVSSVVVGNSGFGYTNPPLVRFLGGGYPGGKPGAVGYNSSYVGLAQPNGPSPSHPATGHAVLTSGTISSIVVDDGGANYVIAPYVQILGSDLDPAGCAAPSTTSGFVLPANMSNALAFSGVFCPTDPVAVIGTSGDTLLARWAD